MSVPPAYMYSHRPPAVGLAARFGEHFNYILYHNEHTRYGETWPTDNPAAVSGPADQEYDADPEDVSRYPSSTLLPFYFGVSSLKLNSRKKGTLIIHGLLGNLGVTPHLSLWCLRDVPGECNSLGGRNPQPQSLNPSSFYFIFDFLFHLILHFGGNVPV